MNSLFKILVIAIVCLAASNNKGFSTTPLAVTSFNVVYNLKVVEMEIWKDVKGYEGLYQVSNLGNIKSIDRVVPRGVHNIRIKGTLRKSKINNRGYLSLTLCKNGKYKHFVLHRLVLESFKDNLLNKEFVNHKDGDKLNNNINNLEWCTCSENNKHAYDLGLKVGSAKDKFGKHNKSSKVVLQIDKNTKEIIKTFDSVHDVQRKLGFAVTNIAASCRGITLTSHGYIWEYKK
jgi:hypothetical protein